MKVEVLAEKIFKKKDSLPTPEYRWRVAANLKRPMQSGEWFRIFKQMREKKIATLRKGTNTWFIERR